MTSEESSVLTDLAHAVARQGTDLPMPHRLALAAAQVLGADGAAITMSYARSNRVTLCTTDHTAKRLEDLQEVVGQGPGSAAYHSGSPVHATLDAADRRWPQLTVAIDGDLTGLMVHAFPLVAEHQVLGVLTCHHIADSRLSLTEPAAVVMAAAIAAALLADPDATDLNTQGPWAQQARIHQAVGMVTVQLQVSPQDASAVLRAHAFAREQSLAQVAAAVVARDLSFTDDGRGRGPG